VLAEFASVVNAVQCGIEIQAALKAENVNMPAERRMEFRIGINLGDVIVDGEQIYGDGVNVAARLESLAEPGGICLSHTVHDQIRNKLGLSYADLGEQQVKNIAEPVRVFRVLVEEDENTSATAKSGRAGKFLRRGAFSFVGVAIIIGTIILVQHLSLRPPAPSASIPPQNPHSLPQNSGRGVEALPLPSMPSIAVLPFSNLSADPQQEYFSDGITDELISQLAQQPGLFVIARTSSFTFKHRAVRIQDIGRELGVRYVLEGSVRKAANRVRIAVQLVDAGSGADLWAQRFDRPLTDIFAVQDDVVKKIVGTLDLQWVCSSEALPFIRIPTISRPMTICCAA
jgi:TolB-like protein